MLGVPGSPKHEGSWGGPGLSQGRHSQRLLQPCCTQRAAARPSRVAETVTGMSWHCCSGETRIAKQLRSRSCVQVSENFRFEPLALALDCRRLPETLVNRDVT